MAGTTQTPKIFGDSSRFKGVSSILDYEVISKLGEGTFGEVHKAQSRKTRKTVALKKILMHNEKDGFPITALREIKLMKLLAHENILELEDMAIERPQSKGKEKPKAIIYMVTPYMDHDLSGLLENPRVDFSQAQIKCYLLQLLEGIKYLHNQHMLHRDIKAANLLINNRGLLQIADFGLARHYDEPVPQPGRGCGEARRDYTSLVVTRWYRPPELLLQLRRYTPAVDMWGIGCVFGEMFKRSPILMGKTDLNQAQIIFDLVGSPNDQTMPGWSELPGCEGTNKWTERPGKLAQEFAVMGSQGVDLMSKLMMLNWRKRINAIDAQAHPYFKTPPLPALRHELPTYEDSHELDKRRFKDQRMQAGAGPPPAPAGGTVGGGQPDIPGDWPSMNSNSGPYYGSRLGGRDSRGPPAHERPMPRDDYRGPHHPSGRVPPGASRVPGGANEGPLRKGWERPPAGAPRPRPGEPVTNGAAALRPQVDTYIPTYAQDGPPRRGEGPPPRRDDRPAPYRDDRRDGRPPPYRDDRRDRDDRDWEYRRDYRDRDDGPRYRDHDYDDRGRRPRERDGPRDGGERDRRMGADYPTSTGQRVTRSRSPERKYNDNSRETSMSYRR